MNEVESRVFRSQMKKSLTNIDRTKIILLKETLENYFLVQILPIVGEKAETIVQPFVIFLKSGSLARNNRM